MPFSPASRRSPSPKVPGSEWSEDLPANELFRSQRQKVGTSTMVSAVVRDWNKGRNKEQEGFAEVDEDVYAKNKAVYGKSKEMYAKESEEMYAKDKEEGYVKDKEVYAKDEEIYAKESEEIYARNEEVYAWDKEGYAKDKDEEMYA